MAQSSVGSVHIQLFPKSEKRENANCNGESLERSVSVPLNLDNMGYQKFPSGSPIPDQVLSPCTNADVER
jgi:serine/threonine-protein kinase OSR1/STK39